MFCLCLCVGLSTTLSCDGCLGSSQVDIHEELSNPDLLRSRRDIQLSHYIGGRLSPPIPSVRVVISPSSLEFDRLELWRNYPPEVREQLQQLHTTKSDTPYPLLQELHQQLKLDPTKGFTRTSPKDNEFYNDRVFQQLTQAFDFTKTAGKLWEKTLPPEPVEKPQADEPFQTHTPRSIFEHSQQNLGTLLIVADINTPVSTITSLIYNAGQAQFSRFQIAVETPGGIRVLTLESPKFCAPAPSSKPSNNSLLQNLLGGDAPSSLCLAPHLYIHSDHSMDLKMKRGPWCSTKKSAGKPHRELSKGASAPSSPTEPIWIDKTASANGVCPSDQAKQDKPDRKALATLLQQLSKVGPLCAQGAIFFNPKASWRTTVTAMKSFAIYQPEMSLLVLAGEQPDDTCASPYRLSSSASEDAAP